MWEDDQNKRGGRWLVNMNKNQRMSDLDNVWQEIVSFSTMVYVT
jgi:translation initiation factor 4E